MKLSSKQRLTTLDEPDPIPANFDALDLSHAIETFHVSTYRLEDLPQTLPVFSKRTGRLRRFVGQKRVASMPILSHEYKSLPLLPPNPPLERLPKRAVSMFPQNDTINEPSSIENSESSEDEHCISYATAKNGMMIKDDDSLFSTASLIMSTSASSAPNESDKNTETDSTGSMLDEVHFSSEDSVASIYSEMDNTSINSIGEVHAEEACIEEPELGSIFDSLSLGDSLWDSDNESTQSQPITDIAYANTSVFDHYQNTSNEQQTYTQNEVVRFAKTTKELPSIPHSPGGSITLPKVRKTTKPRPVSMFSMTNQSNFSAITTPKNLHDSKQDMRSAIGGSIDVCLDSDRDYRYSRYYAVGKTPRASSTTLLLNSNTSFSPSKASPRSFSAHFTNTSKPSQIEAHTTRPIEKISESDKPKVGLSVSTFLTGKLRALSSENRTTNK